MTRTVIHKFYIGCMIISLGGILLGGCWDRVELNDLAIVIATAIDLEPDGKYRVTLQLPLTVKMDGGNTGADGEKAFYIDSAVGDTLTEANERLQKRMSRKLNYSHRRILIVGEELAEAGIGNLLNQIARVPQKRLNAYMVISKGNGFDLLQTEPKFERFSGETMRKLLKMGAVQENNLKNIIQTLNEPGKDAVIHYFEIQKPQIEKEKSEEIGIAGYAQFRDDKMTELLSRTASDGVDWLKNTVTSRKMEVAMDSGNHFISIEVKSSKSKITPMIKDGVPSFRLSVRADVGVLENKAGVDMAAIVNTHRLEQKIAENIQAEIEEALTHIRKNKADSAGFGQYIKQKYPRVWESEWSESWRDFLPNLDCEINVNTTITEIGMTLENIVREGSER